MSPDSAPLLVIAGGHALAVYICERCGVAIVQRSTDSVDRATQHADWHAELVKR